MAKNRTPPDTEHALLASLERIADELNLIRTVLDEMRSDLQWAVHNGQLPVAAPKREGRLRPHLPLFNEGDWVQIDDGYQTQAGEIVELDHAANRAWVAIHPTNEVTSVVQDLLKKQQPDPLSHEDDETRDPERLF